MEATDIMSINAQTLASDADRGPLAWTPRALTLLAAFAVAFAMPVGPLLSLGLLAAVAAGIGIAELRRHGGQGMPALPFTLED